MRNTRIFTTIMLILSAALLLGGCGDGDGQSDTAEPSVPDAPPTIVSEQNEPNANEPNTNGPSGDQPSDEPLEEPPGQGELPTDEPPEDSGEWKAAYLDILEEVGVTYASWADIVEGGITSVSITDITNDGIPELIFTEIDGGDINFSVYGFDNGQGKRLFYLEQLARTADVEHYEAYLADDGRVIVYGSGSNLRNSVSDYYIINSFTQTPVEIELSIKWTYGHSNADIPDYFIDGELAAIDEYDEKLEQIFDGAEKRLASDGFAPLRAKTTDVSMSFSEAMELLSD